MPRIARFVWGGVPHHVTQRGNRRGQVFFSAADCRFYLHLLKEYAARFGLDVLAYCLLGNHVNLVAAPATDVALARVLRPLHLRYAQRVNRAKGWKGHLWQGRVLLHYRPQGRQARTESEASGAVDLPELGFQIA